MPLARLRYFNEVVRTGSIREAAERLNVAPSAISRQIRTLEQEFGLPLFERHARGVVPTTAGELYANYARAALLDLERINSEIDDLKGLRRGHVRICSVEGVVANGLTQALAAFRTRFAGVSFNLTIIGAELVIAAVRNGECDIGISFTSNLEPGVRYAARIRDPLCAIMAPGYPLAARPQVAFQELVSHPLAVPPKGFGIRTLLDARCRSAKLTMRPVLETNSIEAMRGFARTGSGVAFLPRLTVRREIEAGLAVALPLTDRDLQQATVDLCVLEGRRLPSAVDGFLSHLKQVLPTLR